MVATESGGEYSGGRPNNKSAFCRACDDFKSWTKMQWGQNQNTEQPKAERRSSRDRRRTGSSVESVFSGTVDIASVTSEVPHRNCPLDKDELGRSTWNLLHTIAAYYPDTPTQEVKDDCRIFFEKFAKLYPCKSCADHFREQITQFPPKVSTQQTLSRWLCDVHNLVNKRTGKPQFDCSRVDERWRDGWRDGSCD